jgi:hypothetical protein
MVFRNHEKCGCLNNITMSELDETLGLQLIMLQLFNVPTFSVFMACLALSVKVADSRAQN